MERYGNIIYKYFKLYLHKIKLNEKKQVVQCKIPNICHLIFLNLHFLFHSTHSVIVIKLCKHTHNPFYIIQNT